MKQEITERFTANVRRVRNVVGVYDQLAGPGPGRASEVYTDILRAAVVLLHAALEDLLRSLERWRLPGAPDESFKFLAFPGPRDRPQEKLTMVELAAHRGRSVDDVFRVAIDRYLERSNYGSIGDAKDALKRIGLAYQLTPGDNAEIVALMSRRHLIAHRADRNDKIGRGHAIVAPLGPQQVLGWLAAVERFAQSFLSQI